MDSRNIVEANKEYLEECFCQIITKIRILALDFYDKDGQELEKKCINIEGSNHGTTTVKYDDRTIGVSLDGTNFSVVFLKTDFDRFAMYNKELGIKYIVQETPLYDDIKTRTVWRIVGDEYEKYSYTVFDTVCFMVEYQKIDKDGNVLNITHKGNNEEDKEELIKQTIEEFSKMMRMKRNSENSYYDDEYDSQQYQNIKNPVEEDCTGDIMYIDYTKDPNIKKFEKDTPYQRYLPDDVHKFDYEMYVDEDAIDEEEALYGGEEYDPTVDGEYDYSEEYNEQYDDGEYNDQYDDDEYDEEYSDEYDEECSDSIEEELCINKDNYIVSFNGAVCDDEDEELVFDAVSEEFFDFITEVDQIRETFYETASVIDITEDVIRNRKFKLDSMKRKKQTTDVCDNNENR